MGGRRCYKVKRIGAVRDQDVVAASASKQPLLFLICLVGTDSGSYTTGVLINISLSLLYDPTLGMINAGVWATLIVFQVTATILQEDNVAVPLRNGLSAALRVFVGTQGAHLDAPQIVRELRPIRHTSPCRL